MKNSAIYYVLSLCALISIGALVSCTGTQTPVVVATSTIIPSTATPTSLPTEPPISPEPSATSLVLATTTPTTILTVLESTIDLDIAFTQSIIEDLALHLDVPVNRIQVVSVEESAWVDDTTLDCDLLVEAEITPEVTEEIAEAIEDIATVVPPSATPEPQIDGLEYVLLAGIDLYTYHTEGTSRFVRCDEQAILAGEILIAVDPLASETFSLVQTRLATQLDLSTRSVELVDMRPVTWTDTSLGCPQADQTYDEIEIPGYYIEVIVGDATYIFHSDSITLYSCSVEQSQVPES